MLRRVPKEFVVVSGLLALILIGAAVAIVCSPRFQKARHPPVLVLPTAEEIVEMRASLTHANFQDGPPVLEFVVPPDHVPKVLFWLAPATYAGVGVSDSLASASARGADFEVARILIRTKSGEELRLRCHDWGCNPVTCTANGEDFFVGHVGDENGRVPDDGGIDGGVKLWLAVKEAHDSHR